MPLSGAAVSNNDIASMAIGYDGQYGDQCKEFVRTAIQDAGGPTIESGYKDCYLKIGVEIQSSQAMWGDIIQTCNDADSDVWYNGTHSAIVLENKGDNNFKVVDSNWNLDEIVHIDDRNLFSWASGHGTQIHYYRLGTTDHWDFNIPTYTQGWKAINAEDSFVEDGKYFVNPNEIEPWIQLDGLLLNHINYNAIEINMSSNCPDGNATMYFVTEDSPDYAEDKNVSFIVDTNDGWHTYTIYMANHNLWKGTITGIRIDPATSGNPGATDEDKFGFDYIKVIKTDKKPAIVDYDLMYSPLLNSIIFEYSINNPFANDFENVCLGAQIRTNDPQGVWTDNMDNDKVVTLNSGTYPGMSQYFENYERYFDLPIFAGAGEYDAHWVILNQSTGEWYDNKEKMNAFVIEELSPTEPNLDLIILIDTTASMGPYIADAQASATEIVEALDFTGFDYRVAVADYRDYPESPYGGEMDYVYNLDLPFSSDKEAIIDSINSLSLGWGADWRESVYSALVESMLDVDKDTANSDNHGWREGAFKAEILIGDAPPQNEIWEGGYTIDDVVYWSENIDPIRVYSIVVGYDDNTYAAFSEISERTGGKVYSAQTASDVSDAIIKAIEDMKDDGYGVEVEITPAQNEVNPKDSVFYLVNITNKGDLADVYNVSFEAENILGSYRVYPTAIQYSWIMFDDSEMELDPSMSEIRPLTITVPENWAGMEDVVYTFSVSAKSETDETISNTSSAELKVKADKRNMIEYSKLEIQWLTEMVEGSDIDHGIKNSLLKKLTNAESKLDQALVNLDNGKIKPADNMLQASRNLINAFANQVEAQYDKKIMQPDAEVLKEKASQIMEDLEKAKNS